MRTVQRRIGKLTTIALVALVCISVRAASPVDAVVYGGEPVSTIAGIGFVGFTGDGGPAISARLSDPQDVAVDATGNIFLADGENNRIRRIDAATGIITTIAGTGTPGFSGDGGPATAANLHGPVDVEIAADGAVIFTDLFNHRIRRVSTDGTITTIAGTGTRGFSGDGGLATAAAFDYPYGLAIASDGVIFVSDRANDRIRRIGTDGVISTVAGTGANSYNGDGQLATTAAVVNPLGIAVDADDNLYVAESGSYRVRRVDAATGMISTVAGTGNVGFNGDGRAATATNLSLPVDVAISPDGELHVVDANNVRVHRVDDDGTMTTVLGTGSPAFNGDNRAANTASIRGPSGLTFDNDGNLLLADTWNQRVRKVTVDRQPPTIDFGTAAVLEVGTAATVDFTCTDTGGTGLASCEATLDGTPVAAGAPLDTTNVGVQTLTATATDVGGNIGTRTRHIVVAKESGVFGGETISRVAGTGANGFSGDGGPALSATLNLVRGIAVDAFGNQYVIDDHRVRRIDGSSGQITTVAGNAISGFNGDDQLATDARLRGPATVAVDSGGNLFVADTVNQRIRRVDASTGLISTVAGTGTPGDAGDGGPATEAELNFPYGIAVDADDNLYIADTFNSLVRRVDAQTGIIATVAGTGTGGFSGDGGDAVAAELYLPYDVAVARDGTIYIADSWNNRVRRVDPVAATISTVLGTGVAGVGGDGGPATSATTDSPIGIGVDLGGNLYVAESFRKSVRRVDVTTGIVDTVAGTGESGPEGDGGPANQATVSAPQDVALDPQGNLYIAGGGDATVRVVTADTEAPTASGTAYSSYAFGARATLSYSCADTGGSELASCTATIGGTPADNGGAISTDASGTRDVVVTAVDRNGNTATFTGTVHVQAPPPPPEPPDPNRYVTTGYDDIGSIRQTANLLGIATEDVQEHGVAVVRFINGVAGVTEPAPLTVVPPADGTVRLTSTYEPHEVHGLDWVTAAYGITEAEAQAFGATVLVFLANIPSG